MALLLLRKSSCLVHMHTDTSLVCESLYAIMAGLDGSAFPPASGAVQHELAWAVERQVEEPVITGITLPAFAYARSKRLY